MKIILTIITTNIVHNLLHFNFSILQLLQCTMIITTTFALASFYDNYNQYSDTMIITTTLLTASLFDLLTICFHDLKSPLGPGSSPQVIPVVKSISCPFLGFLMLPFSMPSSNILFFSVTAAASFVTRLFQSSEVSTKIKIANALSKCSL